ncbi:MAG: hypothetical protein HQ541_03585 [Mariniphaga sp.]|nr:hypothetical protein [Mariniphaga sp.]
MDLKDLKKAWDQYSSKEKENELDEQTIRKMLQGRTKSLIEKIERNIRIGFGVIFLLILLFIVDDFIISPMIMAEVDQDINVPGWLVLLSAFSYIFIFATFIYFVIKYYNAKKECDITCNLPKTLKKIIHILNIYQRMFYFGLFVLVFSTSINFIAGLYTGVIFSAKENGIAINEIDTSDIIMTIILGLVVLLVLAGGLFLLFRWGFRRLYGNYLKKLKLTLKELNEID